MSKKTQPDLSPDFASTIPEEIEDKAEELMKFRDSRMEAGKRELEVQSELISMMKKAKVHAFKLGGRTLELTAETKEKVKVRKLKDDEDEE